LVRGRLAAALISRRASVTSGGHDEREATRRGSASTGSSDGAAAPRAGSG